MTDLLTLLEEKVDTCSQCGKKASILLRTACKTCYNRHWRAGTVDQIPLKPKPVIIRDRKHCPRCKTVKLLGEFPVSKNRADGRAGWCKQCYSDHRVENFEEVRRRERMKRYGISDGEYERRMEEQGGKCAICRATCVQHGETLSVDHDHSSGKVRGLLCANCNRGVGPFGDNPSLLVRAAEYLMGGG